MNTRERVLGYLCLVVSLAITVGLVDYEFVTSYNGITPSLLLHAILFFVSVGLVLLSIFLIREKK